MAYPRKPKQSEPQAEAGVMGQMAPVSTPVVPQVTRVQGGAPVLNQDWMPHRRAEFSPATPQVATDYPAAPWKREDVTERYGAVINGLAERLWERYQDPKETTTGAFWDNVAANPQEVARMAMTRLLARKAQVQSQPLPPGLNRDDRFRFLQWVRSR